MTLFKILLSNDTFDAKTAQLFSSLYYSEFKNVPKVIIGGMVFYELSELNQLNRLSPNKIKQLNSLKPGNAKKLFTIGRFRYLYAVRITPQEEQILNDIKAEENLLQSINSQIETQVGTLLKQKSDLEKKISKMKQNFS